MRPPEFTGGNLEIADVLVLSRSICRFNEAAGIHRRKRLIRQVVAPLTLLMASLQ